MDILCPTDLSAPAATAFKRALAFAGRLSCKVDLLHVLTAKELKQDGGRSAQERMEALLAQSEGDIARGRFSKGDVFEDITAASIGHLLMVLGTHGPRGLRQNLFGTDILKLVRAVHVPSFVVQEGSPTEDALDRIVLPVGGHHDMKGLLDTVCLLARAHASEVHVYQLMRPGEKPSEQLLENKKRMLYRLSDEGIRHEEVNEPSTMFSMGFAKQTIDYAKRVKAGCIAIMAHASDEYRYIADAEKEHLLTNEAFIPVLCGHGE